MSQNANVGPENLASNYLSATNVFIQLEEFSNLNLSQQELNLPVDTGLSYEIETYQNQLKSSASAFFSDISGKFIHQISLGLNFVALWKASEEVELPLLRQAATNEKARQASQRAFQELSEQSGRIHQFGTDLSGTIGVYNGTLGPLNDKLQVAIAEAIKQLGAAAESATQEIDALNTAIGKNIDDIVAGATETGSAVSELLIGILTTIADAKPDKTSTGTESQGKGTKTKSGDGDANKPPSTDFAVSAITAGSEGVEKTSQARADLRANNEKLAKAYQTLAQANALSAVGKVVAVQAAQFASAMAELQTQTETLVASWGQSPITPPGSGRSLAFQQFADEIAAISSQTEADGLVKQVEFVSTDWTLLGDRLQSLKTRLVGVS